MMSYKLVPRFMKRLRDLLDTARLCSKSNDTNAMYFSVKCFARRSPSFKEVELNIARTSDRLSRERASSQKTFCTRNTLNGRKEKYRGCVAREGEKRSMLGYLKSNLRVETAWRLLLLKKQDLPAKICGADGCTAVREHSNTPLTLRRQPRPQIRWGAGSS